MLANAVKADRLNALGDVRFEQGKEATEHADDYVFVTVFFAIVLFFAGISLRFQWLPMRLLILGLGTVILVYGGIRLGTLADALTTVQVSERDQRVEGDEHAEHGERVEGHRPLVCGEPVLHVGHPFLGAVCRTRSRARRAPSPARWRSTT